MALYHFSVRHVSRGKGQMVVASAAYISGQRIFDSYYNKIHDYTSKSGVVFTEILTPEYVPERLTDRETLMDCQIYNHATCHKLLLAELFCQSDIFLKCQFILQCNVKRIGKLRLLFLSTCSTSFQRVSLSVRRSGTYSGVRISVNTTPDLLV